MTLYHIAINDLFRKKFKMFFVVLGLIVGIATVISLYSIVNAMEKEVVRQMSEYGANIVITPDTGELSFSYGGITVPEVLFDVENLTNSDIETIRSIPQNEMIRAISPRLFGVVASGSSNYIVTGTDLKSDFIIKPWLRLQSEDMGNDKMVEDGEMEQSAKESTEDGHMEYEELDLSREDLIRLDLSDDEVVVGIKAASSLGVMPGDTIQLNDRDFFVVSILQENGSDEDNQIFMNLESAQTILNKENELSVIEVSADYTIAAGREEELMQSMKDVLPHAKVASLRQAVLERDEMLGRMNRFGMTVSILVLVIGALLVTLTMMGTVREKTREIGIFRAIGFRRSDISKIIIIEGALISIIGGLAGYFIGIIMARTAGPLLAGMDLSISFSVTLMSIALISSLIIGILASIYPARQASKLDPVEALRYI